MEAHRLNICSVVFLSALKPAYFSAMIYSTFYGFISLAFNQRRDIVLVDGFCLHVFICIVYTADRSVVLP